jgi:hypothetical protein
MQVLEEKLKPFVTCLGGDVLSSIVALLDLLPLFGWESLQEVFPAYSVLGDSGHGSGRADDEEDDHQSDDDERAPTK